MPTPASSAGAYAIRMPPTETPQGARAERGFTQTRGHSREAHQSGSGPVTRGDGGVFRLIRDNAPISLIARCPWTVAGHGRATPTGSRGLGGGVALLQAAPGPYTFQSRSYTRGSVRNSFRA